MKKPLFLLLTLLCMFAFAGRKVAKTAAPGWIKEINYSPDNICSDNGGYQYLLTDYQRDLDKQIFYYHFAIKILNSQGVQDMSNISISFDPAFTRLSFHGAKVIRGGKEIEKLEKTAIQILQRETNLERALYDGSLTAVLNLSDIREGDIIEYSYSLQGSNPIYEGNYSGACYLQFTLPLERLYARYLISDKRTIDYKLFDGATEPVIQTVGNQKEYVWDVHSSQPMLHDVNVPSWLDIFKRVELTTFRNWEDVVNLALPHYTYSRKDASKIHQDINLSGNKEERVIQLVRFVQDEIRYLGFESGIGAYKPNAPMKVYNQRFGDCKDKSLLLISLLDQEGVEAYPLLVNTTLEEKVEERLPGLTVFNHVVVAFKFDDKQYIIDPTINDQGGNLITNMPLFYKKGLLLRKGEQQLIDFPESKALSVNVNEEIFVDSLNGGGTIRITSEYRGGKADNIRSYFAYSSREQIQKDYLDYYSSLYKGIEVDKKIDFIDTCRSDSNVVTTIEHYKVDNFWSENEGSEMVYVETFPLEFKGITDFPNSPERTMPYSIGIPQKYSQTTTIHMYENWEVDPTKLEVKNDAFSYRSSTKGVGSIITMKYFFETKKEFLEVHEVEGFLKDLENVKDDLGYYISYDPAYEGFKLSWLTLLIMVVSLTIITAVTRHLYRNFNPVPLVEYGDHPISGWVVLPMLGLILSPIVILVEMFLDGSFNHVTWLGVLNYEGSAIAFGLFYGADLFLQFGLIVFSIFLLILLFKKRTSFPVLISIFYIINIFILIGDHFLTDLIVPELITYDMRLDSISQIKTQLIFSLIWIAFFQTSTTVKRTFCKVYSVSD